MNRYPILGKNTVSFFRQTRASHGSIIASNKTSVKNNSKVIVSEAGIPYVYARVRGLAIQSVIHLEISKGIDKTKRNSQNALASLTAIVGLNSARPPKAKASFGSLINEPATADASPTRIPMMMMTQRPG